MKLICIAGLPGTGKTHLAKHIASQTGAIRLSRDEIRAQMFETPDYSKHEKEIAFGAMLFLARQFLRQGRDVILEGMPFSRREERDAARELALEMGADFQLIHCICPEEVAIKRIASQEHPAADRNVDLYYRVRERFEPFGHDEQPVEIDTSQTED